MKAIVLRKGGAPEVLRYEDMDTPEPEAGQARVRLHAAGLNHRDVWQRRGYVGEAPAVLGSDGAGTVDAVGSERDSGWLGKEVMINASLYWGHRDEAPTRDFEVLGVPSQGTYAEQIVVPVENLVEKPAHLTPLQAASIPLAGLTAWRALFTQGRLQPGQTVLLPGIGGGVAGIALAFAKGSGARVIVTSSSDDKLALAREQGADVGVNYGQEDWERQVSEAARPDGVDLVVDHSGAETVPAGLRLVRHGGRVVYLGLTTGDKFELNLRATLWKQVHLISTILGSPREFEDMVRWINTTGYTPEVRHEFPLSQAAQAHELMEAGGQYGKIMLLCG